MYLSRNFRLVILLLMLGCTAGCDQTSKHIARIKLGTAHFVTFPGGFGEFRLAENPGSFLSVGDTLPASVRLTIFTLGAGAGLLGLLSYLTFGRQIRPLSFIGFGLVWAGGMSNLFDRIVQHGLVSDFIFIRVGPLHTGVFNVADAVIMLGLAVVAFDLWQRQHKTSFHL